jgi:hypothetical protein
MGPIFDSLVFGGSVDVDPAVAATGARGWKAINTNGRDGRFSAQ